MSDPSDDAGTDPADAFAALSDPVRVDVLRELSAHARETGEAVVGFADLRRRVGVRDSGRFRYHLNQLRPRFVERADDGYRLTQAGVEVVGAVLAGTYTGDVSLGPAELDSDCPFCGGPVVAQYGDGRCVVTCPEDHPLFQWRVPPNAAVDASLREVVAVAQLLAFQAVERALAGRCPRCYDAIEAAVVVDETPDPLFRARCDACGGRVVGPVAFPLLVDPVVAAFCRRHGLTLRSDPVWEFPFVGPDATVAVAAEDPVRVECSVSMDGETLRATVDDAGQVVEVETDADS